MQRPCMRLTFISWNLLQVGTRGLWLCKKGTNKPLYSSVVCGGPYMHYMQVL